MPAARYWFSTVVPLDTATTWLYPDVTLGKCVVVGSVVRRVDFDSLRLSAQDFATVDLLIRNHPLYIADKAADPSTAFDYSESSTYSRTVYLPGSTGLGDEIVIPFGPRIAAIRLVTTKASGFMNVEGVVLA